MANSAFYLELGLAMLALWTMSALPVMKLSARTGPIARLALVALGTFACVALIIGILSAGSVLLLHTRFPSPPLAVLLVGFLAGDRIMVRWLRNDEIGKMFPGIGARAMLTAIAATIIAFGAMLWWYAGPIHQL